MLKKWMVTALVGVFATALSWAQGSPAGQWQTFDEDSGAKKAIVQITQLQSGELIGKVIKLIQKPGAKCVNCDGSRKNKPIEGMTILWGLQPDGENEWDDGEIFDPHSGKTYSLKVELSDDGQTLELRGYLGFSLLGRTQTWKRIK